MNKYALVSSFIALSTCAVLPVVAAPSISAANVAAPRPIAVEKNPPGDIPDNQAFVAFRSPMGFSIKVPEGWARRDQASGVAFSDKYNTVEIALSPRHDAPSVTNVMSKEVTDLELQPKAIRIQNIKSMMLPAGSAVVVAFEANSDPNPVTNKAIRLESANYYFWKGGRLATLTLSAPAGADNVDQWRLIARSFAWL